MRRGLLAEFESADACAGAIEELRRGGHRGLDAYMPYPSRAIERALALPPSPLPKVTFVCGLLGAAFAYLVLWYTNVYDYNLSVGGRPSHAVPSFIPITFETLVLLGGIGTFVGCLVLSKLPRLHDPVLDVPGFEKASADRFFLLVDGSTDRFAAGEVTEKLEQLGARSVRPTGPQEPAREQEGDA